MYQTPFKIFFSYRNHVYAIHGVDQEGTFPSTLATAEDIETQESNDSGGDDGDSVWLDSDDGGDDKSKAAEDLQKAAATWIINVREGYALPQSSIELILGDVPSLYEVHDDRPKPIALYYTLKLSSLLPYPSV